MTKVSQRGESCDLNPGLTLKHLPTQQDLAADANKGARRQKSEKGSWGTPGSQKQLGRGDGGNPGSPLGSEWALPLPPGLSPPEAPPPPLHPGPPPPPSLLSSTPLPSRHAEPAHGLGSAGQRLPGQLLHLRVPVYGRTVPHRDQVGAWGETLQVETCWAH